MTPIRVIPCNRQRCTHTLHLAPEDEAPKGPWWCPEHATEVDEAQLIISQGHSPTISIPVKEVVTPETLQQKAFIDIAVMMAFNQFSEVGMKHILESLSRNSFALGSIHITVSGD